MKQTIAHILAAMCRLLSAYGAEENLGFFMVLADGKTFTDLDGCRIVQYSLFEDTPEEVDGLLEIGRF
jgi:hypothetical protein